MGESSMMEDLIEQEIVTLDGLSNYRYNRIGGIDADKVIGEEVYPYTLSAEEIALLIDETITDYVPVIDVPLKITRRQAIQQLLISGYLSQVEPIIAAIPDELQRQLAEIYWKESTHFERNNNWLMAIGNSLGLTSSELDQLFIDANKL
jgi:hypothetical protein